MHIVIGFIIVACLLSGFHPIQNVPDSQINLDIGVDAPVFFYPSVTPLAELLKQNTVQQAYDYSCGSAALATLLNFYLNENLTENSVIQGLMEYGNARKITDRRAFSLLDMKKFVNRLGYRGVGYKAELDDIIELGKPCIIPIEFLGYRHFTVFRGVHGNHIFLADTFRGNTSYTFKKFKEMWFDNVLFVVYPEGAVELSALKLKNEDLRYIDESRIHDLILDYTGDLTFPEQYEREFIYQLPDEYNAYFPK